MAQNATDSPVELDDLSRLQKRVEELGSHFYTCLGVLQRDAPPIERAPDETEEQANDEAQRKALNEKIPQFAQDIITCSRDIDRLIDEVEAKMKLQEGKERILLENADHESRQAGEDMSEAVDDAQRILTSVRDLISAREVE